MPITVFQRIRMWGDSLAVRLPEKIARAAGLTNGSRVQISAQQGSISIVALGAPEMTLAERLALYDPERHGGELMAPIRRGKALM